MSMVCMNISRDEFCQNVTRKNMKYNDYTYLIDVDDKTNKQLIQYYETKRKEHSVIEYYYVGPTYSFGLLCHHYKPDYSKIHFSKPHGSVPADVFVPDESTYYHDRTTSEYFGNYVWGRNELWDFLYREKEKYFLIMKN